MVNLRACSNDEKEGRGTTLRTERTRILTWDIDDHHVIEVMRMLRRSENGPFSFTANMGRTAPDS